MMTRARRRLTDERLTKKTVAMVRSQHTPVSCWGLISSYSFSFLVLVACCPISHSLHSSRSLSLSLSIFLCAINAMCLVSSTPYASAAPRPSAASVPLVAVAPRAASSDSDSDSDNDNDAKVTSPAARSSHVPLFVAILNCLLPG